MPLRKLFLTVSALLAILIIVVTPAHGFELRLFGTTSQWGLVLKPAVHTTYKGTIDLGPWTVEAELLLGISYSW